MSKRHYQKIESRESKALKRMRLSKKGTSQRKLSELTGLSASAIAHAESGRVEEISEAHVSKVIRALGYTNKDWRDFLLGNQTRFDLQEECISILGGLDTEKLRSIYIFLKGFT